MLLHFFSKINQCQCVTLTKINKKASMSHGYVEIKLMFYSDIHINSISEYLHIHIHPCLCCAIIKNNVNNQWWFFFKLVNSRSLRQHFHFLSLVKMRVYRRMYILPSKDDREAIKSSIETEYLNKLCCRFLFPKLKQKPKPICVCFLT